jgi:hypothetical protein
MNLRTRARASTGHSELSHRVVTCTVQSSHDTESSRCLSSVARFAARRRRAHRCPRDDNRSPPSRTLTTLPLAPRRSSRGAHPQWLRQRVHRCGTVSVAHRWAQHTPRQQQHSRRVTFAINEDVEVRDAVCDGRRAVDLGRLDQHRVQDVVEARGSEELRLLHSQTAA